MSGQSYKRKGMTDNCGDEVSISIHGNGVAMNGELRGQFEPGTSNKSFPFLKPHASKKAAQSAWSLSIGDICQIL